MISEFNELLTHSHDEKAEIWIIGTRDRVTHLINEFCARKSATDRLNFTPIVPAPFSRGKYMTILMR